MKKHSVFTKSEVLWCGCSKRYERSVGEKLRLVKVERVKSRSVLKAMLKIFKYRSQWGGTEGYLLSREMT